MTTCSASGTHVCTSCGVGAWICTIEDGDCKGGGTCSACVREQVLGEMEKSDEWEWRD